MLSRPMHPDTKQEDESAHAPERPCAGTTIPTPAMVHPLRDAVAAVRANLLPGLIIQAFALAMVLAYYYLPAGRSSFAAVSDLRARWDLFFAFVSTATFGGAIPWVVQRLRLSASHRSSPSFLFLTCFWGLKGLEVHALYQLEAHFIGTGTSPGTILTKVITDQLIYVPLWATPITVLAFLWKDCGYRLAETRAALRQRGLFARSISVNLANWGIWIPVVALIYLLETPLQLPLQNLVLCLWSLLVLCLTRRSEQ